MVAENLQCGFLSYHSGGAMEEVFGHRNGWCCVCERRSVCVCLFTCVWECDMDVHALVCRLVVVYLFDNNEGFIFVDKTIE